MSVRAADVAAILDDDEWLTTAEAATRARRSTVTIRRAAADGTLESTSAGRGRGRRYRKSWVDAWVCRPARTRRAAS